MGKYLIYHGFHKNMKDYNMDYNKKCYLSSKSAYQNDFWRINLHWRLD